MGSRRLSKLTPALRPEAPLELPALTELQLDVGEPFLRTLWDMTLLQTAENGWSVEKNAYARCA